MRTQGNLASVYVQLISNKVHIPIELDLQLYHLYELAYNPSRAQALVILIVIYQVNVCLYTA